MFHLYIHKNVFVLTCSSVLHVVDINEPRNPEWVGCFEPNLQNSYVHDVQCELCSYANASKIERGAFSIMLKIKVI